MRKQKKILSFGYFNTNYDNKLGYSLGEMAQRFVGGALVTYSIISISGRAEYMKMADGSYFGGSKITAKAWRAGWINQASDFAYSSPEAFMSRNFTERVLMFAGAAGSEAFAGGWDDLIKYDIKKWGWKAFATFGTRSASGGMDYWLQQSIHHAFNNDPKYLPWQYKYGWKKASMAGIKAIFYGLAVE